MSLIELCAQDVEAAIQHFEQFHQQFAPHFTSATRTMSQQAKQYIHGQLTCQQRGNLWAFEKNVPNAKSQSMQHFITHSPWKDEPLLDDINQAVVTRIGDEVHGAIHIDESGFPKSGEMSVGVARQYCGRLGKVDNCQMGVFLGYTQAHHRILLDRRLYLPQKWSTDNARRKTCGVPKDVEFQTKAQQGLELVRVAQKRKIPYAFIGFDCHYGQQPWLLQTLESEYQTYIADIPCDTRVWLECPVVEIPKRKGNRGPIPTQPKVAENQPAPIAVRDLFPRLDASTGKRVFIRETERGPLWVKMWAIRVYPVRDELPGPQTWLIVRCDESTGDIKYQFSNATAETSFERLAYMSHSRFWMERAIEDAKGQAGMADYQLRSWNGWHHHMTMTILAMLFLLVLHLDWKPKASNLTLCDVREILLVVLPKRTFNASEILLWIEKKHKARLSARYSHARCRKHRLKSKT